MKKKIANVLEIVLFIIAFVMLWLPLLSVQAVELVRPLPLEVSVMGITETAFVYVICFLFGVNILMCLVSIIVKKQHRDGKMHVIMPILLFSYCCTITISVGTVTSDGVWEIVECAFPSMLFLGCLFGAIIISIVKRSTIIAGLPTHNVKVENVSQADELKKYKELLDNGAITQEEFDKKKKQLLK